MPRMANDRESEKASAAARAVQEVRDGMLVGLGTGSTAGLAIRALAERIRDGLHVECVATSLATETIARSVGLAIRSFEGVASVDLTIDGADEIDGSLRAIKGGGGALMREKIVASASHRMLVIIDSSKFVSMLGRFRLPVEALPFAAAWVERSVIQLGGRPQRRLGRDGSPFLTDQGNVIFDCDFGEIADPKTLAKSLDAIPGLLEHGLFVTEIDAVFIGRGDRVEVREKPQA